MTITQEQIKKIAKKLSKIPSDNEKIIWNIWDIIKYVELLDEVDTKWVIPTISVVEKGMPLREDVEVEKEISPDNLINCSNQKVIANQIIIPNIMK